MKKMKMKLLTGTAKLPTRGHPADAGLDLYASKAVEIRPYALVKVPTGLAIDVEEGYVGLIRDRSSVSLTGLKITAGVIDAGYHGEVVLVMINTSSEYMNIQVGQKVAQLLVVPVALPEVEEVSSFEDSDRGQKGFGSTDSTPCGAV